MKVYAGIICGLPEKARTTPENSGPVEQVIANGWQDDPERALAKYLAFSPTVYAAEQAPALSASRNAAVTTYNVSKGARHVLTLSRNARDFVERLRHAGYAVKTASADDGRGRRADAAELEYSPRNRISAHR